MTKTSHNEKQIVSKTICADMVYSDDHNRYLTTLFVDKDKRRSLLALYAFNIEISKVVDSSKEPLVNQIKLQWWRDSLEGLNTGLVAKHPVIEELSKLLTHHKVDLDDLLMMIEARNNELMDKTPKTLDALIEYCRQTAGTLNRLSLQILKNGDHHSHSNQGHSKQDHSNQAENLGTAWGLIGIIRAISFHATAQRCFIPDALLEDANIKIEDLYKGEFSPQFSQAIQPICEKAEDILKQAITSVPKDDKCAFLLAPLARNYISRLKASSYDIQKVDFESGNISRLMRLTRAALLGRL